jgi:branched-chain amino acid transport system permease protein
MWQKLRKTLDSKTVRWTLIGAAVLVLVLFPFLSSNYWIDVAFYLGVYTLLGLSLNIILGEVGLFNLGHAAFWAIGAYATAILNTELGIPVLVLLPVSAIVAGGFAWLVSSPIIHLRGDYLAIVTIALGEIVRLALNNDPGGITGGPNGVFGIDRPVIAGLVINTPMEFYFLIWVIVLIVAFALVRLQHSRIGRAWNYIRGDELAAEAMGVNVRSLKLLAFVLGAGLAGVAGNIYAGKMMVVSPDSFTFMESCMFFAIVLLGGMGSVPGTFLGAVVVVLLPEIFRPLATYRMLIFGLAMIVVMYLKPGGMWPRRRIALKSALKGE